MPPASSTRPTTLSWPGRCEGGRPASGRNTASATSSASGPATRTTPIAPSPGAVAIAAMVSPGGGRGTSAGCLHERLGGRLDDALDVGLAQGVGEERRLERAG